MNFKDIDTAYLDESTQALVIIDQTKLPASLELMTLTDEHAVYDAIKRLCVRGAPAIGVSAAIGLYVCAYALRSARRTLFLPALTPMLPISTPPVPRRSICIGHWSG